MKQLLLRVPDELHERLADQAAESGRSINSLATAILDCATEGERGSRRARLRARAAALNLLVPAQPELRPQSAAARAAALESTRGVGPVLDAIIEADRERP